GHVLVGDVDVPVVATEVVGPNAALVPEPGCGLGLAGSARGALSLPRHDLEGDVEAGALVACQPHGAGTAASEWPERSVPVEDELSLLKDARGRRHDPASFVAAREGPSRAETVVGRFP